MDDILMQILLLIVNGRIDLAKELIIERIKKDFL